MPVNPHANIEISAFAWVPPFAAGVVRDLRVRWALEEAGIDYRERLLDAKTPRPADYFEEQPFGQVPIYNDDEVRLFESGAIVLHIGQSVAELLPREPASRARATAWVLAALNSVEPPISELATIDIFNAEAEWGKERRPQVVTRIRERLGRLADWLGDRDYLEDRFTAGDLMMTTVLRNLRHTEIVAEFPSLAAYQARCEGRPAFQQALAAQLAAFERDRVAEPA